MSIKDEIIRVYKRKVMAYPEGAVVHMGDCNIYNDRLKICTCGLHHWLLQAGSDAVEELYPQFLDEQSNEGFIDYLLEEFERDNLYVKEDGKIILVKEPEPLSEDEIDNLFNELKGTNDED